MSNEPLKDVTKRCRHVTTLVMDLAQADFPSAGEMKRLSAKDAEIVRYLLGEYIPSLQRKLAKGWKAIQP